MLAFARNQTTNWNKKKKIINQDQGRFENSSGTRPKVCSAFRGRDPESGESSLLLEENLFPTTLLAEFPPASSLAIQGTFPWASAQLIKRPKYQKKLPERFRLAGLKLKEMRQSIPF